MKTNKYLMCLLKDFFTTCGCLILITVSILAVYSIKTINISLLWRVILVASAYTFFKFALVNNYELGKKEQMLNFFICFTLADVMIIILLCFLAPGKSNDLSHIMVYAITIILVKGLVYAMIYSDGKTQAKQLNEKLIQYKNHGSEC